jgi:DNA-binding IclR family transcriptional regulator
MVLKVFSEDETELGISSIAKRLQLAKSTVHRLAVTLTAEGFLEQNPENGRYRLGLALFELGTLVRRRMDVSTLGLPLLGALRDESQETVHLAILHGASIVYLFNLESAHAIGMRSYLGSRKPRFAPAKAACCWRSAGRMPSPPCSRRGWWLVRRAPTWTRRR